MEPLSDSISMASAELTCCQKIGQGWMGGERGRGQTYRGCRLLSKVFQGKLDGCMAWTRFEAGGAYHDKPLEQSGVEGVEGDRFLMKG